MMRTISLKSSQIKKIKELQLEDNILNTESSMWILNEKISPTNEALAFKLIDAMDDGMVMGRKNYTIDMLSASKKYQEIEELIIPKYRVEIDGKPFGYAMELINNHQNVGKIINDEKENLQTKLPYLSKIGDIVKKVQNVTTESFKMNFGDLNEYNFILNKDGKMKVVDLDSAYIGQDKPLNMPFYFQREAYMKLKLLGEKYKILERKHQRIDPSNHCHVDYHIFPNDDSDLYCYNMMILSILSKSEVYKLTAQDYYAYINYLSQLGINQDLIKSFKRLYIKDPNLNPVDYIETINPSLEKDMEYKTFQKRIKR